MSRARILAAVATLACASVTGLTAATPASAHGSGCRDVQRRADAGMLGYGGAWVQVSTVWTVCNTHAHPRANSVALYFASHEDEVKWKGSGSVSYSCVTRNDNRVASRFSGTLSEGDRVDGYPTVAVQDGMHYPSHPRTTCSGKISRPKGLDGTYSMTAYALK